MKVRLVTILAVLLLALPAAARAQTPAEDVYDPFDSRQDVAGVAQSGTDDGDGTATATADGLGSGLPFTGMDVAFVAAGGIFLVAAGAGIRRAARPGRRPL